MLRQPCRVVACYRPCHPLDPAARAWYDVVGYWIAAMQRSCTLKMIRLLMLILFCSCRNHPVVDDDALAGDNVDTKFLEKANICAWLIREWVVLLTTMFSLFKTDISRTSTDSPDQALRSTTRNSGVPQRAAFYGHPRRWFSFCTNNDLTTLNLSEMIL